MELPYYNLVRNPFQNRTLDFARPDDEKLFVREVDGCHGITALEPAMRERARAEQPMCVVVMGGSGTGRTTVAHYLVKLWRGLVTRRNLVVRCEPMPDSDVEVFLTELVLYLRNEIESSGIHLADSTSKLIDSLESLPGKGTIGPKLERVLRNVDTDLKAKDWGFACVIERAPTGRLLEELKRAFAKTAGLVVVTVDDVNPTASEVRAAAKQHLADSGFGGLLELNVLPGADVRVLIDRRWTTVSPLRNPFDLDGLEEVFSTMQRPIARVLFLLSQMLVYRHGEVAPGAVWPDDDALAFTRDAIRNNLPMADVTWREVSR
ncbi:hypothetical protein [Virgisporangium ochraceum]|nr:hypothetical protein [Virgisporangium ochraceum]